MISSSDIFSAKVLIVDDQDSNVYLLEQMLVNAGYTSISSTKDPHEVCALHRENDYSLILLDLQMPDLDGFQVMKALKGIETDGYLPVLVQTAQPSHRVQALSAGAKDFVSKPFDLEEVLLRVYNMIEVRLLHRDAKVRTIAAEKSEREMRASALNYRRLFEAAQDGILILDADAEQITEVNPSLARLLGFSADEFIGRTLGEMGSFKSIGANLAVIGQLQRDGFISFDDLPLETKDGRTIYVQFVSSVYAVGDRKVLQCNLRDVTDRKQARDEVRLLNQTLEQRVADRTIQLEEANKELQSFSYSVSHDLRAPLRHVLGFVNLLRISLGPSISEESQLHLDTISDAAKRMGNLIDDLLAFSRFGTAALQKTDVNLDDLVPETLKDFQTEMMGRDITFTIHPLGSVWADRALLRLVLANLISNALKFTMGRAGSTIEIGPCPNEDPETVIFIRDNGVGFNPKYTDKLFRVFQRLHSKEEFEGTGIGLANVQRIVQRHGGRCWGEGVINGGATFCFSIPKQKEST